MAVTRLERKGQKNKAKSRVRKQMMKVLGAKVQVASPYKEESGIVLEGFDMDHFVKTGEVKIDQPEGTAAEEVVKAQAAETIEETPTETEANAEGSSDEDKKED